MNLPFLTHFELQEFWDGQSENDDVKAYTNSAGGISEKVDVDAFCIGYGSVPRCSYFGLCQFRYFESREGRDEPTNRIALNDNWNQYSNTC